MKRTDCVLIPTSEYTVPRSGQRVYVNYWWLVTNDQEIIYYTTNKGYHVSPQGNPNESVCRHLADKLGYPFKVTPVQIPLVYETDRDHYSSWNKRWNEQNKEPSS